MSQTTFKYNPSQQSADELEQTFVGRQELLEGILSELKEQRKGSSRQHYVIIGPRGIGKTNLLLMIHYAIKKRSELAKKWIPVQLAEESYSVLSLADFLLETIKALSDEVGGLDEQIRDISASNDDQTVIDRSMDLLRKTADAQSKSILVLVDNLDMILEDQMRDQMEIHRLRSILMAQDFITIIGTSPTLFNELTNYDSPLYNFFKPINLKELSGEEMEELIARRLTMEGKPDQAEALAQYRPRLQAIRHLTGGNPRLLLMLYQICEHGAIPEVKQALETLLDELTPYFKHRMESLAPQMRKVLDTMARSDGALTPTEIAREARVDVKLVNVQLARMKEEGLVTSTPVRGKRITYYAITERLFRIWYKMRLSRKDKNEVYFLAEFFQAWYQAEEMLGLISGLGERFREALADGDHCGAQRLLQTLHIVELASSESGIKASAIVQEWDMLMRMAKPAEAADVLEQIEDFVHSDSLADFMDILSVVRRSAGQWTQALRCAERAFAMLEEQERDWSRSLWTFRGIHGVRERQDKASLPLLNTVGEALGAADMSIADVSAAMRGAEATADSWLCFAWWLCALGEFAAASVAYRQAQDKATSVGDVELARTAEIPRLASGVLVRRLQVARCSALPDAVMQNPSQAHDIWTMVIRMAQFWLGVDVVARGSDAPLRVPEVTEVSSPLDVFFRAVHDAADSKGNNAQLVSAHLGDERSQIAKDWIEYCNSAQSAYLSVALTLGLRERAPGVKDEKRQIAISVHSKPIGQHRGRR